MAQSSRNRKQRRDRQHRQPHPEDSRPLISVCMIARNEEKHLEAAWESADQFADEVIVLDTGSTDGTVALARKLGMKVHRFEWIHDFAAARNESFRHCRGRYIFWQDPDETVPEQTALQLRDLAGMGIEQEVDEFRILTALNGTYRPPEEDIPGYGPGFRVLKPRMVRNVPAFSWINRIHETTHWSRAIRRRDCDGYDEGGIPALWVFNHGNAHHHDTVSGEDYYYALMVLGHRENPGDPHYSLYLAECAIIREANPQKAIQYLDTIKDPTKLGSSELQEKYFVMRGRAYRTASIHAHDQGAREAAGRMAQEAMKSYAAAVDCNGSQAPTLEAAGLALYLGDRAAFVQTVTAVRQLAPENLMAVWFEKLIELYEDPAELNVNVGNWLFNLRNGEATMEQAFEMVTQGADPLQTAETEGAWDWDEQGDRQVSIIIGYRADDDQLYRVRNLKACLAALGDIMGNDRPPFRVILVEQDSAKRNAIKRPWWATFLFHSTAGEFNRGRAFNIGARSAAGLGSVRSDEDADLLCLMDADLLVDPGWIQRCLDHIAAAEKLGRFPGAMLPYSKVVYMDQGTTEAAIAAGDPLKVDPITGEVFASQGGCMWITAGLYDQLGGHDERYEGWGSEDRDFFQRVQAAIGRAPLRMAQVLYHLWHPPADKSRAEANSALYAADHDTTEAEGARQ